MIIWGQFSKGVSSLREKILPNHQGDQIRRIFAQWVNVYSGQLLQLQMHPTYLGYFIRWINLGKNFDKKWVGSHFGWFFQKLIWSPCQPHVCIAPHCVSRSTYIGTWFVHGHRPHAILSNATYVCLTHMILCIPISVWQLNRLTWTQLYLVWWEKQWTNRKPVDGCVHLPQLGKWFCGACVIKVWRPLTLHNFSNGLGWSEKILIIHMFITWEWNILKVTFN
jgi:hypothetical protein